VKNSFSLPAVKASISDGGVRKCGSGSRVSVTPFAAHPARSRRSSQSSFGSTTRTAVTFAFLSTDTSPECVSVWASRYFVFGTPSAAYRFIVARCSISFCLWNAYWRKKSGSSTRNTTPAPATAGCGANNWSG
jgi:hypothetical protein